MTNETPIARGRTAEIYAWESGKVLKVYQPGFSQAEAAYEANIATKVQESGIACPRFYEMTEFQGRPALVYERIDGATMAELALKGPWRVPQLARRMAKLHRQMHAPLINADLPLQRERFTHRIETSDIIPADLKKSLLEKLATLPDDRRLCHGDFHPGNIMSPNGRDLTIDWIDASVGHPLADVARTSVLLLGIEATVGNPFIRWIVTWFHDLYLREYFAPAPHIPRSSTENGGSEGSKIYRAFLPIVAAARLAEGIPELQDWLLEQALQVQGE
jgi:uncharacterized protein (TIGR02172 family)